MKTTVFPDDVALAETLANEIVEGVTSNIESQQNYLLGCPGGRTPSLTLKVLAEKLGSAHLDLGRLNIAMMDEYVVAENSSYRVVSPSLHFSVRRYITEHFLVPLNTTAELNGSPTMTENQIWFPDPANPLDYDKRLVEHGGVDLFILASGASDGHIAFNPPGTLRSQCSTIFSLAETTKIDNLATFPAFQGVGEVPSFGVSVGVATIVNVSKRAVMVATGLDKKRTVSILSSRDAYDPAWPSTIVLECRNAAIYVDEVASCD